MNIKKQAQAGTTESNDCIVRVKPASELIIKINSPVKYEFGDQMEKVIKDCLREKEIDKIQVELDDNGALDCTIKSRLETAIGRGI